MSPSSNCSGLLFDFNNVNKLNVDDIFDNAYEKQLDKIESFYQNVKLKNICRYVR